MPQMSIYFDEALANVVHEQALKNNLSVSKYVSTILYRHLGDEWPESFVKSLGSLGHGDLVRPAQPSLSLDAKREQF